MKTNSLIKAMVTVNLLLLVLVIFLIAFKSPETPPKAVVSTPIVSKAGEMVRSAWDGTREYNTSEFSVDICNENKSLKSEAPINMPAAMAEMDPRVFMITDLQVAEWETLQEEFINEVGNKLPTNAAEWERWESARQKSDEMFQIKFGDEIYQQQLQAASRENRLTSSNHKAGDQGF